MKLPPKLADFLETMALVSDRQERIELLIDLADKFKQKDASVVARTESNRIPGCESEVYIALGAGGVEFAVDNPQGMSAMAMAYLLESTTPDATAEQIEAIPDEIVFQIFGNELSMGKNLGLTNMLRMLKRLYKHRAPL